MENIRRWFENDQMNNGQNYEIDEYEGYLEARTDTVIFMVVEPHSGTKNRWVLRVSTKSAFDRWANSTAIEEFFDSDIELCNYLYDYQLDIYKDLVRYLSREYDDIAEEYQQENFVSFGFQTETITVETINKNKYKKEEVQNMDGFMMFKKALQKHFDEMQKEATHLFEVNVDKDELWNTYLDSFPAGTNEIFRERREHDCSCCRQ